MLGEYAISVNNGPPKKFVVQGFFSFEDRFLQQVTNKGKAYVVLNAQDIDALSMSLAQLMTVQFNLEVEKIQEEAKCNTGEGPKKKNVLLHPCVPVLEDLLGKGEHPTNDFFFRSCNFSPHD